MDQLSQYHRDLFAEVLRSRPIERDDRMMSSWEHTYGGAYISWTQDSASPEPYNNFKVVRAYLKGGDDNFSPGDLWSRHLLVRCFLMEARQPHAEKQIWLREEALRYCKELQQEFARAKDPLVTEEDIAKMEELVLLEKSVLNPQQHSSALHKLKGKVLDILGRK